MIISYLNGTPPKVKQPFKGLINPGLTWYMLFEWWTNHASNANKSQFAHVIQRPTNNNKIKDYNNNDNILINSSNSNKWIDLENRCIQSLVIPDFMDRNHLGFWRHSQIIQTFLLLLPQVWTVGCAPSPFLIHWVANWGHPMPLQPDPLTCNLAELDHI